jgi:hypothetical protein
VCLATIVPMFRTHRPSMVPYCSRDSTRIPSSNTPTPSAYGISSPSFLGVSRDNSPYRSDPISIDGSPYVQHPDTTSVGTRLAINEPVNTPIYTPTNDVAWLLQASPNGNFAELLWPPRRSLVEGLNIDPCSTRFLVSKSLLCQSNHSTSSMLYNHEL